MRSGAPVTDISALVRAGERGLVEFVAALTPKGEQLLDGIEPDRSANGTSLPDDYWLRMWCETYGWVEKTAPERAIFVCYEDLCRDPNVWQGIAETCRIARVDGTETFSASTEAAEKPADGALARQASELYERLQARSRVPA